MAASSGGEAQIGGAQLGQLAPSAPPRQGQVRVLAGGDDQVHPRRHVLQKKGEGIVDRPGVDGVIIVEHEDEIFRHGADFIQERRQNRFDGSLLGRLEHRQHFCTDTRLHRLQSGNEIHQEAWKVAIPFVQRQPCRRSPAGGDPFARQGGFPESGRRGDERQFPVQALVQPLDQGGAEYEFRSMRGSVEFRGKNRRRHGSTIAANIDRAYRDDLEGGFLPWYKDLIRTPSRFYLRLLLASAVLFLGGAAVALVLAYATSRRSIEQGFHEQARAALDAVVRNAEGWLEVVEGLQSQAPLDRDIRRYLTSRKAGSADAIIRLEDAIAGMRARIPAVRVLENLAVYLVDEDILVTSLGAEEPRYFFDRYVYEVPSNAEIDRLVRDADRPALFTRRVTYEGGFSLVALGRNSQPDQRRVTVIAHLKPQYLLPEEDPGKGAFLIWSPEAGLLASRGAVIEPDAWFSEPVPATGRRVAAGGRWYRLYTARDELTGWIFAYAGPEADLSVPLRRLGLLSLLIALGVLSAAALIAFLVAGTVYRPVDAVLRRLFPESRPAGVVDEFEAIGGLFSQLSAQNVRLSDVLAHARPTLQEHAVRDIVGGRISADDVRARLEEADLSFERPLFTVVVLSPANPDPAHPELAALMGRAVVAHARALLGGWTSGIAETDDERIAVLINHDDAPDQRARIRALVREIQESVHRQLHVALTAVVGTACTAMADLHRCYRESVRTLETAHLWPPGVLVMAEDAAVEPEEASFTYPVERERSIINAAVAGDCEYAARGVVAVLEANLVGRSLRADARGHLLTAVAGTIARICHRLHVSTEGLLEPGRDIYGAIAGTQDWEDLKRMVETIFAALAAAIARERKQHDDRLRDRFREYIQGNYRRNISLFDMAEAFGLTPSYLSELFKERMGQNYIEYLTAFRMEVARDLLTSTSAKVNDVAAESGYANVTSFIRVFKKHEGVSPGAFRELHQRTGG